MTGGCHYTYIACKKFEIKCGCCPYLNSEENHRNDCGRPGINGGFIDNPYVKFGVNCYGVKPEATEEDLLALQNNVDEIRPKTKKEKELEKKIEQWKENKDKYLKVNSYNKEKYRSNNL